MTTGAVPLSLLAGSVHLDQAVSGWTLHEVEGEGSERELVVRVEFERPFAVPPVVHASLAGLDADHGESLRVAVVARFIDSTGFVLSVKTWRRTKIYAVDVSWLAIGR